MKRNVTLKEARELYIAGRISAETIDRIEAEARRREEQRRREFEAGCVEVVIPGGDDAFGDWS